MQSKHYDLGVGVIRIGERLRGSVLQIVAAVGTADDQIELLDDELG